MQDQMMPDQGQGMQNQQMSNNQMPQPSQAPQETKAGLPAVWVVVIAVVCLALGAFGGYFYASSFVFVQEEINIQVTPTATQRATTSPTAVATPTTPAQTTTSPVASPAATPTGSDNLPNP